MSGEWTLAAWNVNSIKARLERVQDWLKQAGPDFLFIQELKCADENFPAQAFRDAGYEHIDVHGQKSYNGVAVIGKYPFETQHKGLPALPKSDDQARYIEIEADIGGASWTLGGLYAPNGNPVSEGPVSSGRGSYGPKFDYKLKWLRALKTRMDEIFATGKPAAFSGDFNIIPEPRDCYDPEAWAGDALYHGEARRMWRIYQNAGFLDAYRALNPSCQKAYTFWDYQGGAWRRNNGIRIDHILLTPEGADRLRAAWIDPAPRGEEKASDHTPVLAQFVS